MSNSLKIETPIPPSEYLEGEPHSEVRHEYIDGAVYAMAGGTQSHNLISGNIFASLHFLVSNGPCRPFINDMKVRVKTLSSESYYYPDVMVACEEIGPKDQFIERPKLIIEVLSESTERIDRNEKFLAYTSLASLDTYILVSQDRKEVTVARRENQWQAEIYSGDDFEIPTCLPEVTLASSIIYRNVTF